jgi:hypothetical protein
MDDANRGPRMRNGTTDRIAWKHFFPKFKDVASDTNRATSIDGHELVFLVISAAEFQAEYGAAPQPHVDPGLAAGAAAAWKFTNAAGAGALGTARLIMDRRGGAEARRAERKPLPQPLPNRP